MHSTLWLLVLIIASSMADRGLEITQYRQFPQSRQRDRPWERNDFCIYNDGSSAISGFGQIDTSFPDRIYYASSHVVGWCTYDAPTYVNYVYYAHSRGARNATFRLHPSQSVAYISRWEDQRVFFLPISNVDYVPDNPSPEKLLSSGDASWPYLELDSSSGIMWAVGNQGPTVVKLGWHRLPTNSLDMNVRSLSSVLSTNCYTIFFTSTTAYFGCFGSIMYMPKTNNPVDGTFTTTQITSLSIGAGQYQCGAIDTAANRLYLGSTIGLGLEWDTSSNSLLRIFFLTSSTGISPLRTVVLDKSGRYPVLWWATGDSRVIRVNTRDFSNIFAQATAPRISDFRSMAIDPSQDSKLLLGQGWTGGDTSDYTYLATRTDCSLYTCTECLSIDLEFCGVCSQTGLCSTRGSCNAQSAWRQDGLCPRPLSLSPSSGSISGDTTVIYVGTTFEAQPTTVHQCKWTQTGKTDVINAPVAGSVGSITCKSPSTFSAGTAHLSILLVLDSGSREYSAPQAFEMYDCSAVTSCSDCSSSVYTECGWCLRSASCSSPTGCPNFADPGEWLSGQSTSLCPAALSVVPASIGSRGNEPVTVTTANILPPSISLKCQFGAFGTAPATRASSNTFSCTTPALAESTFTSANQSIAVSLLNADDLTITVTSAVVELYNCSAISQCSACRDDSRSLCGWLSSNERRCIFASDLGSGESLAPSCPTLTAVDPPSMETSATSDVTITLNGADLEDITNLECIWTDGASQTEVVSATFVSTTAVDCRTPASGLTEGVWFVALGVSGVVDSNQVSFLSYDCASGGSCDVCLDPLRTTCLWCRDLGGLSCGSGSPLPGCTHVVNSRASCPHLTTTEPASLLLPANVTVDVRGTHYLQNVTESAVTLALANVRCAYELSAGTVLATAIWNDADSVTCDVAPAAAAPETAQVYLTDASGVTPYTNRVALPYVNCNISTTCGDCLASSEFCNWCGDRCSATCDVSTPERGCPSLHGAEPDHASILGDDVINIVGENLLYFSSRKRASPYTCDWGGVITVGISVSNSLIQCITPTVVSDQNVTLTVYYNGVAYLGPMSIAFFSCPLNDLDYCGETCLSNSPYCGWCVGSGTCGAQSKCPLLWQSPCIQVTPEPAISSLEGGTQITATLSSSLPDSLLSTDLACAFGTTVVPASFLPSSNQVTCTAPARGAAAEISFQVLYGATNARYSVQSAFSYIDCASSKSCDTCIATANCGWCGTTKKCTLSADCPKTNSWSNKSCPVNALALGLGIGLGLFVLLLLGGLIIFLIRRRRVKQGLIIDLEEPDYLAIAFGSDVTLAWRVPEHNYKLLDTALARRDFLIQLAIGFNCPATEQDALAKALVYVASKHGIAAEMIQTCIRSEVRACKHENTLFRNNSVASRMYKFYSRIVGIKYLFHCIARVILELEVLGREQISATTKNGGGKETDDPEVAAGRATSLLSLSMELDQTKALDDDMDTETNLLQLQLICQKLLNVLIKTSVKNIPPPFRKIFVEIDNSVMGKFAGSNEAVYKGIGGLFFLRFVCPAITAPHVYGLLKTPPNTVTQRQLVLISKVIQSIANMQPPGKKEEYMTALTDFINQAIPRITKFYDNLRQAVNNPSVEGSLDELEFEVPDAVHLNGLATTWNFIWTEKTKLKTWADASPEQDETFDHTQTTEFVAIIDDCVASYPAAPKKFKTIGTTVPEGKEAKRRKKKTAS